ncbi:MAG: hypothetical protein KAR40_11315 [Candidatus Sabulitectum sp.]|nr:hypothetical protein [Candidatus Sabulitectum sp.]
MSVNEDKVKEAIERLATFVAEDGRCSLATCALINLREAIAPEQPEIPEGCPVIITYDDGYKIYGHMDDPSCSGAASIEIDYQRKGHVIPWYGGKCPVDEGVRIEVFRRDRKHTANGELICWRHANRGSDVVAYVIWPEWVKS